VEKRLKALKTVGLKVNQRRKRRFWSINNQNLARHGLYGLQRIANILSTETPTGIGGNSATKSGGKARKNRNLG
jgi:hypothetical protein